MSMQHRGYIWEKGRTHGKLNDVLDKQHQTIAALDTLTLALHGVCPEYTS